jgi:hypothetical protein
MMLLVPIANVAATYQKLEGRRVEATGVLVGVSSGGQVHVLYMVRELAPVEAVASD